MKLATVLAALAAASAWGQSGKLPDSLEGLGAKAEEKLEVTLDKAMLQFASKFLSGRGEEAKARRALAGLDRITVRSFSFGRDGEYSRADVDAFRAQFRPAAWGRVMGARSTAGGENIDVFVKAGTGGQIGGAVVISEEARKLTIVQITGTLDPDQLADLSGQFHIPHMAIGGGRR